LGTRVTREDNDFVLDPNPPRRGQPLSEKSEKLTYMLIIYFFASLLALYGGSGVVMCPDLFVYYGAL